MATKKIPMRMCTACREMKPKAQLIRIVKTPEGEIKPDDTGKLNGRGAYICREKSCFEKAVKSNSLARAFSMQISPEVYEKLSKEMESLE